MRAYQRLNSSGVGARRAIVAAAPDGEAPAAVRTPGSAIPPLLQKGVSPGLGGRLPETESHLTASGRIRGPAASDAFLRGNLVWRARRTIRVPDPHRPVRRIRRVRRPQEDRKNV